MTPDSQLKPELITLTQYEALPEDKRAEVFEGTVYNMAGPSQIHQALSMQLSNIIFNYIKNKNGQYSVFTAPSMSSCPTPRLQLFNRTSWLSVTKIN